MPENRLWILGADDPEMSAIEKLLTACGEKVAYAIVNDKRVHPGNAYRAVATTHDTTAIPQVIVIVECDGIRMRDSLGITLSEMCNGHPGREWILIDHHCPDDPGYGKPPEDFLSASSIGQVWMLINHPGGGYFEMHEPSQSKWVSRPTGKWGTADTVTGSSRSFEVPLDSVLTAAADHCLGAAYQGQCPGVDPDALMTWRVSTRATHQGRTEQEILNDIRFSCDMLRGAPSEEGTTWSPNCIRDMRPGWDKCLECKHPTCHHSFDIKHNAHVCLLCASYSLEHHDIFPELPEAACREGVAYLATVTDSDNRVKDVLGGCTTPEMVTKWMAACKAEGRETYGDPARGFAGAYQLTKEAV